MGGLPGGIGGPKATAKATAESEVEAAPTNLTSTKSPGGMNDDDVKCYEGRYSDLNGKDGRTHFTTVGQEQGRLPTCAKNLSDFEAQKYLDRNPDLQHSFGRTGKFAKKDARDHFTDYGKKEGRNAKSETWDEPWYCGDTPQTSCGCTGTLYIGAANANDTGDRLENFNDFRTWKYFSKKTTDWNDCNLATFGVKEDPYPDMKKQCWCEPEPQEVPTRCAEDGGDCLCNGLIYFTQKYESGTTKLADFYTGVQNYWSVQDANKTKNQTCGPELFEDTDVLPGEDKQCFCDENKKNLAEEGVQYVKQYWRGIAQERAAKEAQATAQAEAAAAAARAIKEAEKQAAEEEAEKLAAIAAKKKAAEQKAREEKAAAEEKARAEAKAAKLKAEADAALKKAEEEAAAAAAEAARLEAEAEAKKKAARKERNKKIRRKLMKEAEKEKEEAVKAAIAAAAAKAKAEHDEEVAEFKA